MARSNPQPEQALAQEIKVIGGLLRLLRHLGILRAPPLRATLDGGRHQALPPRAQRLPPAIGILDPRLLGILRAPLLRRQEPLAAGNLEPLAIGNLDPRLRLAIGEVLLRLRRLGPPVLLRGQHLGQAHLGQGRTGRKLVDCREVQTSAIIDL